MSRRYQLAHDYGDEDSNDDRFVGKREEEYTSLCKITQTQQPI